MLAHDMFPLNGSKWLMSDIIDIPPLGGNTYFVVSPTATYHDTFVAEHQATYQDGSNLVYETIQAAVDATVSDRGDNIFVMPKLNAKWTEQVVIANKNCVSLYGVSKGGWSCQMRPSDATTKYPFTTKKGTSIGGATFNVLSKNIEIAGFMFDGGGGYAGVYAGGGLNGGVSGYTTQTCHSLHLHHNIFRGADGGSSLYLNGIKSHGIVEDNVFTQGVVADIEMDAGNASNEFTVIRRNDFMAASGAYGIYIYGEANSALQCLIRENSFKDGVSKLYANPIINNSGSTGVVSVAGNFFATANEPALLSSDWTSCNLQAKAGAAAGSNYFVSEENPA